jgi:hypothetical protein
MRTILRALPVFLAFLCATNLGAQSSIPRTGAQPPSLSITTNAPNAQIIINSEFKGVAPATIKLKAGTYNLTISAKGFRTYTSKVMVNGPTKLDITLESDTFALNINSNVPNAQFFVDGVPVPGNGRFAPGKHDIRVTAPGNNDYVATINLNQDTNITATLNPMLYPLTISTNVAGAQIFVDGNLYQPGGAYTPGTHTISASAPGYQSASSQLMLAQPSSVSITLSPALATIHIVVPQSNIDQRTGFNAADPKTALYVDEQKVPFADIQVMPGIHTIRFVVGGLTVTGSYTFNPGQVYVIQPQLGISIQNQ